MAKIFSVSVLGLVLVFTVKIYQRAYADDGYGAPKDAYTNDDLHNHDGSHPDGPKNCGTNYMLPGEIARLGSHSFMIIGATDATHIIAEHRSGTPPHNYQYLFRIRLSKEEMADYQDLAKKSQTLPAFTTIYFDEKGKQLDRTFFCLADLPKIFGSEKKKGDEFDKLFPIRASLQKDPDHEGGFDIERSVYRGHIFSLERDDFELILYRYLPEYLPQDPLRLYLATHAPVARQNRSYMAKDGIRFSEKRSCPKNFYLKNTNVSETIHTFVLLGESGENTVLVTHYYDYAPQNFQTAMKLKLTGEQMKVYRAAAMGARTLPLLQTENQFCFDDIRVQLKKGLFKLKGKVYKDSVLDDYKLGVSVGEIEVPSQNIELLVNRRLESFMNPAEVAADVKKKK